MVSQVWLLSTTVSAADDAVLPKLERSFWLHASLASKAQRGYWGAEFPEAASPAETEIRNAARLLTRDYAANRLYLIYHRELPPADAERVFATWRKSCPADVEIVPTLLLRAYDKSQSAVFSSDQLRQLCAFFKRDVNATNIAVYDVYKGRDQGDGLAVLAAEYPGGIVRVGIQPDEPIASPFASAVADTWSAFCHAKSNDDWSVTDAGAQTLRRWVELRNRGDSRVAWDLIVVAWDYSANILGSHPGYDDAAKNMPLPEGRVRLASKEILRSARRETLAGFSSDLLILDVNSRHPAHDGARGAFYETLKRGEVYRGYYGVPFRDVIDVFSALSSGAVRWRDDGP